jgi:hypothetical protein
MNLFDIKKLKNEITKFESKEKGKKLNSTVPMRYSRN